MKKINYKDLDILNDEEIKDIIDSDVLEELEYYNFKKGDVLCVEFGSRCEFDIEKVELDKDGNIEFKEICDMGIEDEDEIEDMEEFYFCDFEKIKNKKVFIYSLGDEMCDYYFVYGGK